MTIAKYSKWGWAALAVSVIGAGAGYVWYRRCRRA